MRNVLFAAVVVEVEEVYDESAERVSYHVTVDRCSVVDSQDDAVQDRWSQAEKAACLVDAAANRSGVRRERVSAAHSITSSLSLG